MKPTLNELYKNSGIDTGRTIVYGNFLLNNAGPYSIEEIVKFRDIPEANMSYSAPWSPEALRKFDEYITMRKQELMEMWREP